MMAAFSGILILSPLISKHQKLSGSAHAGANNLDRKSMYIANKIGIFLFFHNSLAIQVIWIRPFIRNLEH